MLRDNDAANDTSFQNGYSKKRFFLQIRFLFLVTLWKKMNNRKVIWYFRNHLFLMLYSNSGNKPFADFNGILMRMRNYFLWIWWFRPNYNLNIYCFPLFVLSFIHCILKARFENMLKLKITHNFTLFFACFLFFFLNEIIGCASTAPHIDAVDIHTFIRIIYRLSRSFTFHLKYIYCININKNRKWKVKIRGKKQKTGTDEENFNGKR